MAKKVKVKIEVEKYQAIDGTVFDFADQCEKYDNSAFTVIKHKLLQVAKKLTPEEKDRINPEWSGDYTCYLLPVTEKTCDLINHVRAYLFSGNYLYSYKEKKDHIIAMYISNCDENVYFIDMTDQINAFNEVCKNLL